MVNFCFHKGKVKNPKQYLSRFEPIILFFEPIIYPILAHNVLALGAVADLGEQN